MPIVDGNNNPIDEKTLKLVKRMLRGSLESHISGLKNISTDICFGSDPRRVQADIDSVGEFYKGVLKNLDTYVKRVQKSEKAVKVEDFLGDFYDEINKGYLKKHPLHVAPGKDDNLEDDALYELNFVNGVFGRTGEHTMSKQVLPEFTGIDHNQEYKNATSHFKLSTEKREDMDVSGIADYDPEKNDGSIIRTVQMGNSDTLKKAGENSPEGDRFKRSTEWARTKAIAWKRADHVEFSDLYNTFCGLNIINREGDIEGGKLRGNPVGAGKIRGVASSGVPAVLYMTLTSIAENMNTIKQTKDRELQKQQAIELADFAFRTTLEEHVFMDANGRSCRLLSDAILQTFNLPPHTPAPSEEDNIASLGDGPVDFKNGAAKMALNVKKSSDFLEQAKLRKEEAGEKTSDPLESGAIKVTAKSVEFFNSYYDSVLSARGLKNSNEYTQFVKGVRACRYLSEAINNSAGDLALSSLDGATGRIFLGGLTDDQIQDGKVSKEVAVKQFQRIFRTTQELGMRYMDYKLKDRTANPQLEPEKKALNRDDKRKLQLIGRILPSSKANRSLTFEGKAPEKVKTAKNEKAAAK